jgi:di/tricarboxylate transporter
MTADQGLILGILLATIAMFLWGRWRHDMVALAGLLACVVAGLVRPADAFAGFGHPAVITVACVLILSRGLQTSGAVDALARVVLPSSSGPTLTIGALTGLGALLSAFMNNVGALALLMPVAIQIARRQELPPGRVLMPLAFGSILGGMTTLIGTPPNLIVSGFRDRTGAGTFAMFDFTPVGIVVAVAGIALISLVGWRLVPARKQTGFEGFESGAYLTEARVPEGSKADGQTLREIDIALEQVGAQVIGFIRNEVRVNAPNPGRTARAGDILIIEAEAEALAGALSSLGLKLEEASRDEAPPGEKPSRKTDDVPAADEIVLMELAILPGSMLAGRSASDILLRSRYGINLLAVSASWLQRSPGPPSACCQPRSRLPRACWHRWRCAPCRHAPSMRRSTGRSSCCWAP